MPILVIKSHKARWILSHAVPSKGTKHPWGAKCLAAALVQSGFPKVILKSDNEPAVVELKRAAVRAAREEVGIEVIMDPWRV